MNHRSLRLVSGFALLVAGCNTPQQVASSTAAGNATSAVTTASTTQVVADAKKICGYVADAGPVVQIIASGTPGLSTANAIATAICKAVASQPAPAPGVTPTPPTVAGVVVTGKCVASGCKAPS